MRHRIPLRFRARLVSTALAGLLPGAALAQEGDLPQHPADEAAVRAVVEGFHDALSAGDSTRAIGYLHPDLVVYEGGHAETLGEYRSGHLAGDMAFSGAVEFATTRDAVLSGPDFSLYLREYSITGTYRDRTIDAHGTESIVLVRTDDGWKIRHVHWSSR